MLEDFCAAMAARGFATRVITYPRDRPLGYKALQDFVCERLPDGDRILLGESFSGPVALRIAAIEPPGLRAVVLAASFGRFEFPFKRPLAALAEILPPKMTPLWILVFLLMNGMATAEQKRRLRAALASVAPGVLRLRLREAATIDLPAENLRIRLPLLYLGAENDRLMRPASSKSATMLAEHGRVEMVPGPHFILQTSPETCATLVADFSASLRPVV